MTNSLVLVTGRAARALGHGRRHAVQRAVHLVATTIFLATMGSVFFACASGTTPLAYFRQQVVHMMVVPENRRASANHLAVIGNRLRAYHQAYGCEPERLADLEQVRIVPAMLQSPLGGYYVLTGIPMGAGKAVVCREECVPGGGGHVLYADGTVAWVSEP